MCIHVHVLYNALIAGNFGGGVILGGGNFGDLGILIAICQN